MSKPSKWGNRLTRLGSMDRGELFDRFRQRLTSRADSYRYRSGFDFQADFGVESSEQTGHFFFDPSAVPEIASLVQRLFPSEAADTSARAERICRHEFDLLGFERLQYGAEIDWHSDVVHNKRAPRKPWFKLKYLDFKQVGDSKITWELNRHQHFVTLAKAYWFTGNEKFVREIFDQWDDWHKENPYPIGINWASSLEVAFRSLSWIWTYFLLEDCPLFTADLRKRWRQALGLNGRHIATFLSTFFSPNTHLLGEAAALFSIGTLFPELRGAQKWREQSWKALEHGAATQVAEDGFYFEQSTYYHVYALDIFLHARILAGLNGVSVSPAFDQSVQQMLNALLLLGRAGVPPRLGDDDGGRWFDPQRNREQHLLDPLAAGAILYARGDIKSASGGPREETIWLFGTKGLAKFESLRSVDPTTDSSALSSSGFYLMADAESGQQLLIDAGPLGQGNGGHGHADALSVCLVRDGRELLMDSGTFEYVGDSGERGRLRGTGAHNTLQVDGKDQAHPTGPFSWDNRLRVKVDKWIVGRRFGLFEGSHDGYSRLAAPVSHRRWVFQLRRKFWLVLDRADGQGQHQLDIAWHIGPTLSPAPSRQNVFADAQGSLALLTAEGHGWAESARRDFWSPVYGRRELATVLNFNALLDLPAEFTTLVVTDTNVQPEVGRLVRLNTESSPGLCAFRYSQGTAEHNFIFSHRPGQWSCGSWSSDADFFYWCVDHGSEQYNLILSNGSYANAGRHRVLSCGNRISYAEVCSSGRKSDVFSSDPKHVLLERPLDRVLEEKEIATLKISLTDRR